MIKNLLKRIFHVQPKAVDPALVSAITQKLREDIPQSDLESVAAGTNIPLDLISTICDDLVRSIIKRI